MKLSIVGNTYSIDKSFIEKVALAAFSYFEDKKGMIEFNFVSNDEIERLNGVYRDKNKTTDVLSFILDEEPLLGQIFICYNIARDQAAENNKEFKDEVAHLLVHGILHSYGFDHVTVEEEKVMVVTEEKILNKIGIAL